MRAALTRAAHTLCALFSESEYRKFNRDLQRPREAQERVLRQILSSNAQCEFGADHRFATIKTLNDFKNAVPLSRYEDYEKYGIEAKNRWVSEPVLLYEPTSGSSGGSKLIPYTKSLKKEFQNAIKPWIADLYHRYPRIKEGRHFWSITPKVTSKFKSQERVGFEDDSEYLGFAHRLMTRKLMVLPSELVAVDQERARTSLLISLLLANDLTLISVWSPTYLILLVEEIIERIDSLLSVMSSDRSVRSRILELQKIFLRCSEPPDILKSIWPNLSLISCWSDGFAKNFLPHLSELFPGVKIQPKGLIATEGIVTIPFEEMGHVLAVNSHVFEFLPVGDKSTVFADELEEGGHYSVVITNGGGLYRYQLGDIVEVTGRTKETPTLRFLGREESITDFFGEKLNEHHVQQVVNGAFEKKGESNFFAVLSCEKVDSGYCYCLIVDCNNLSNDSLIEIADEVEERLSENFHYQVAREAKQLGRVKAFRSSPSGLRTYTDVKIRTGFREGDVKPVILQKKSGWLVELDVSEASKSYYRF